MIDTRRYIYGGFVLLIILFLANSCTVPKQETREKPNIIFIMTDDHGTQGDLVEVTLVSTSETEQKLIYRDIFKTVQLKPGEVLTLNQDLKPSK